MDAGRAGVQYQKTVHIDGYDYKIHSLIPSKAFKLGARLAKVVGEPLAAMASASGDADKAGEFLPKAIKALQANLDEEQVWTLIKDLLCSVEFESKFFNQASIETHFQARIGHLFDLFGEVVKFQFSDFFSAIGKAIGGVAGKAATV